MCCDYALHVWAQENVHVDISTSSPRGKHSRLQHLPVNTQLFPRGIKALQEVFNALTSASLTPLNVDPIIWSYMTQRNLQ